MEINVFTFPAVSTQNSKCSLMSFTLSKGLNLGAKFCSLWCSGVLRILTGAGDTEAGELLIEPSIE